MQNNGIWYFCLHFLTDRLLPSSYVQWFCKSFRNSSELYLTLLFCPCLSVTMLLPCDIFFSKTDTRFRCTDFRRGLGTSTGGKELWKPQYPSHIQLQHRCTLLHQHLSLQAMHSWIEQQWEGLNKKPLNFSPYAVFRRDTANIHISRQLLTV